MFKPMSLHGLYSGTQETFVRVGKGEIDFANAPRKFFVVQKFGRSEFYSVWLPEGMTIPLGEMLLVRTRDETSTLIARLSAPSGQGLPRKRVVHLPGKGSLPWYARLSYEINQGENGEVAILRAIDGVSV